MERIFKVGDVCRIREWDDMAAEFGLNWGDICCQFCFTREMKYLCGKIFTIKEIIDDIYYRSVEGIELAADHFFYSISADMLQHIVSPELNDEDMEFDRSLSELLGY